MPNKHLDLKGVKRGYLTAVRPISNSRRGIVWRVRCRCGEKLQMPATEFRRLGRRSKQGIPASCGCYHKAHHGLRWLGVGDLSGTRWRMIVRGAEKKGLPFDLTIEYAWRLFVRQEQRCALTGLPLAMPRNHKLAAGSYTASLDRIDSTKGYLRGNVQWVHLIVNDMKSDFSQEDFVQWCCLVAEHARRSTLKLVG